MYRKLCARDYLPRLQQECQNEIQSHIINPDGTMQRRDKTINLLTVTTLAPMALRHAVVFSLSGKEGSRDFASACLAAAETGLVENNGLRFWPHEFTPSLCAQGRWIRTAYYAARATGDRTALNWLMDMMDRWPYLPEQHRFVERLLAGPAKPTSVGGFSHTYNMTAEGAVDGWMLGLATGNQALMDRCEDQILNYTLPGQRADGHWDYRARSESMTETESCLPEEYNYSFYTALVLSNLLAFPQWKDRIVGPVRKSYDALRKAFEYPDGSIYAPVHWGWNHLWESTSFSMLMAWRLYKHAGLKEYGPVVARALHWEETAQIHASVYNPWWDRHTLELLVEDFVVEGEVAEKPAIIETLKYFDEKLSTPFAGNMQYGRYYGDLAVTFPLQRKIQCLLNEVSGVTLGSMGVPRHPKQSDPLRVSWYKDPAILNHQATFSWNDEFLYAEFQVANDSHWQPYDGIDLFRGDGVILVFHQQDKPDLRINLVLEQDDPAIFLYNPAFGFGPTRTWLPKGSSEGDYLKRSQLQVDLEGKQVRYVAKLAWQELGLSPVAGVALPFSYTVTKLRPVGFQHLSWGKDPFDPIVSGRPGQLVLR